MRRWTASEPPSKVSLPTGVCTTAAGIPVTPAGVVIVPAIVARNVLAAFAFFDPRLNVYGDAPAEPATRIVPSGAVAIDSPFSPSNGSLPTHTDASFALPFASKVHTNALPPDASAARTLPVTCTLPSGPTAMSCVLPNPGPPTLCQTKLPAASRSATRRFGSAPAPVDEPET